MSRIDFDFSHKEMKVYWTNADELSGGRVHDVRAGSGAAKLRFRSRGSAFIPSPLR